MQPPSTLIHYLSGRGVGSEVEWEFRLEAGRGSSAEWRRLPVPAHWEQHGYGAYNYGHDEDKVADVGFYRHKFQAPAELCRERRVELVFDGVMTDATVQLNGQPAGPTHRGGFTRFAYDVTALLRCGAENELEVRVDEVSADASVEDAERDADYWVFGGIFRPVFLRSRPLAAIDHVALDARADGRLRAKVRLAGTAAGDRLRLRVTSAATGAAVGEPVTVQVGDAEAGAGVEIEAAFPGVQTWSAEQPRLYWAEIALERGTATLHSEWQRFGFRTVELRADGFYVNGARTVLKGVNRHVFYPDSGRVSNAERDRRDVELIRSLNLNAVRASHYPPDVAFLDACDELGLFVLDELPGWHGAYDTEVGRGLVRELVERDVNHPSIVLWNNGNEKGWNTDLDGEFARHDPQARLVLHPQKLFSGIDTLHYPTWVELRDLLDPPAWKRQWTQLRGQETPLAMPTEFLHGLYDGGGGAGLADFWPLISTSPRGLGGFFWSFTDEAISRSDREGALDTAGSYGPDGLLGPWREPSGSVDALREVLTPMALLAPAASPQGLDPAWDGRLHLANRFAETPLDRCQLEWRWWPSAEGPPAATERRSLPAIAPGAEGEMLLPLPAGWSMAWGLELAWRDPRDEIVASQLLPVQPLRRETLAFVASAPATKVKPRIERSGDRWLFLAGDVGFELDPATAEVVALRHGTETTPWAGALSTGDLDRQTTRSWRPVEEGNTVGFDLTVGSDLYRWRLHAGGWIRVSYQVAAGEPLPGILFPFPDSRLAGWRWLGKGPSRVYANRDHGALGWWRRLRRDETAPIWGHDPKFAGFYGGVRRGSLALDDGFGVELALEEPLYVALGMPRWPADAEDAVAAVLPREGLAILNAISAMGTKFDPAVDMGPPAPAVESGRLYRGAFWLRPEGKGADDGR